MSNYYAAMKTDHVIALISTIRDKANKLINKELKTRNLLGLTPSHGAILFELFHSGTIPMKEIAERINRDKSTVTALIKKLMTLGFVEKIRHPNDSRLTLVRLTKKGLEMKPDFDRISKILLERIYKGYSTKDKETIISGLERLLKNLQLI
jgi:MarR family transcriptional regulator, organic hydroperoxide resistance regulator